MGRLVGRSEETGKTRSFKAEKGGEGDRKKKGNGGRAGDRRERQREKGGKRVE